MFDGFKSAKLLPSDLHLDIVITGSLNRDESLMSEVSELLEQLETGETRENPFSYLSWEKVPQLTGRSGQQREAVERIKKVTTVSEASKSMMTSLKALTEHLSRNKEIKGVIKNKREEVLENERHAMIHMDWAENLVIEVIIEYF